MGCAGSRAAPRAAGDQLPPPPLADARHLRVKLVLLGDSGVGKSCIVMRFVRGSFDPDSKVTVGAACTCPAAARRARGLTPRRSPRAGGGERRRLHHQVRDMVLLLAGASARGCGRVAAAVERNAAVV